ncbi:MAG: hypothetical protein LC796_00470 [Acidobacteria bacterium]|nr:hypothetical protein [Acidobacteriota bacterium]MCA1609475.1 hypothetical protein [Acidobacteriota bacterium]
MTELPDSVKSMFETTQPVVRSLFRFYFGLTDVESETGEIELQNWLGRFTRRRSCGETPTRVIRRALLAAACRYGLSRTGLSHPVIAEGTHPRQPFAGTNDLAFELDQERATW